MWLRIVFSNEQIISSYTAGHSYSSFFGFCSYWEGTECRLSSWLWCASRCELSYSSRIISTAALMYSMIINTFMPLIATSSLWTREEVTDSCLELRDRSFNSMYIFWISCIKQATFDVSFNYSKICWASWTKFTNHKLCYQRAKITLWFNGWRLRC